MEKKFEDMSIVERFRHMQPIWRREDACKKMADQVMELNNRGLLQAGGTMQVGAFTASLSADRWDTCITQGARVLMSRKPDVDMRARVYSVEEQLDEGSNWRPQWDAAYRQTLAAHPMGVGYHVLRKFRAIFN